MFLGEYEGVMADWENFFYLDIRIASWFGKRLSFSYIKSVTNKNIKSFIWKKPMNFFMNNEIIRKIAMKLVWIISIIPAIILFQEFWQLNMGGGGFSGLFLIIFPVVVLVHNSIVGGVIGLVFGVVGTSGLRVLVFSSVIQSLAVIAGTARMSDKADNIANWFIGVMVSGLLTLPALPLTFAELGIFYAVGYWLGKKYRAHCMKKNVETFTASV